MTNGFIRQPRALGSTPRKFEKSYINTNERQPNYHISPKKHASEGSGWWMKGRKR